MSKKKSMDVCLRRLKQELVSMKEAGDGLHAQMNSMMGALQELKLLQVQTALNNLNLSARHLHDTTVSDTSASEADPRLCLSNNPSTSPEPSTDFSQSRTSEGTLSSSSSSLEMERSEEGDMEAVPQRWSGYVAPQADFYGPTVGNPPPEPYMQPSKRNQPVDLPGILYSLSREGPSLDNDYSQDSTDDAGDWTSSLMNRSRNRQPLVLGDNIFADLVGNWLDLPAIEPEESGEEGVKRAADEGNDRPDTPAHPLRLSRSQEICRKFSLTTNIFKKFLRGVRPDRDKLLKERPGWMAPELCEGNLVKRPKKSVSKSSKGSFYLPFWANGPQGKVQLDTHPSNQTHIQQYQEKPFTGIYLDRRRPEGRQRKMQPLFDYNTAVWV
ncbi:PAK4-inhibitor INKA2 [Corythoichthys intestinalis]|uniref:PAK4-inhibitor INKA2 n=1 Tax=Corythoichthys intestinalis TaxID=161448 RepID=UPI0025A65191|nr:PAK4-inhibitor INKA2 [Corythoichthys intestinalis]XP_061813567.1 PAK4-inhibitor INKA2 [Nerophis lumbriciformis]